MRTLNVRAWFALAVLAVVMGLLLFVSAGTADFWQAWVYLSVFFGTSALITLYLMEKDPGLLKRRMSGGPTAEKEATQRVVMFFASLGFIALLVVPALDHRFGWSAVPLYSVVAGDFLIVLGFFLIFLVYRANTFASATVEVVAGQRVISTGPYAIVRHPMYASASLYLIGTPLALGSYWGLLGLAIILPALIWRLLDEEKLLAKSLPGYTEYQQKVRRRLLPFVW